MSGSTSRSRTIKPERGTVMSYSQPGHDILAFTSLGLEGLIRGSEGSGE